MLEWTELLNSCRLAWTGLAWWDVLSRLKATQPHPVFEITDVVQNKSLLFETNNSKPYSMNIDVTFKYKDFNNSPLDKLGKREFIANCNLEEPKCQFERLQNNNEREKKEAGS